MSRQQEQGRERPSGYRSRFTGTDLQAVKVLHGQTHLGKTGFTARKEIQTLPGIFAHRPSPLPVPLHLHLEEHLGVGEGSGRGGSTQKPGKERKRGHAEPWVTGRSFALQSMGTHNVSGQKVTLSGLLIL